MIDEESTKEEHEPRYQHEFSKDELDQMLYLWDNEASQYVREYLYMKKGWKQEQQIQQNEEGIHQKNNDNNNNNNNLHGNQTNITVNEEDVIKSQVVQEDKYVHLELDTTNTIHIVEFYAPWCPHCRRMRGKYIEMAKEIMHRSIGISIQFHAVSCGLFKMICRAYSVKGYPVILGYPIGSNIKERGVELNRHRNEITIESIANDLDLVLAHVPKQHLKPNNNNETNFSNSEDRLLYEEQQIQFAKLAAIKKQRWHEYQSTIEERYHNAAVSLFFVLQNGVYLEHQDQLDDMTSLALKEFLQLLDWTTPTSWRIRTGLVHNLLHNFEDIVISSTTLETIVIKEYNTLHRISRRRNNRNRVSDIETSTSKTTNNEHLNFWGGLDLLLQQEEEEYYQQHHFHQQQEVELSKSLPLMPISYQWTKACTHSERGLGYTCGLWNLFHIITIGSSYPVQQLYGFHKGYLTSPADIAEIIKRFIDHFFACDVCRMNFIKNYNLCGQNHCERLVDIMPILLDDQILEETKRNKNIMDNYIYHDIDIDDNNVNSFELAKWLVEMHNTVNVRLMKESADQENRHVTKLENQSAIFPTPLMCPMCWLDDELTMYDSKELLTFLRRWYWPRKIPVGGGGGNDDEEEQSFLFRQRNNDNNIFQQYRHYHHHQRHSNHLTIVTKTWNIISNNWEIIVLLLMSVVFIVTVSLVLWRKRSHQLRLRKNV